MVNYKEYVYGGTPEPRHENVEDSRKNEAMVYLLYTLYISVLHEFTEFRVFCYTDFLILDYLPDLRLYTVVVVLYHPLHFALARHLVDKTVDDRDFLVAFSLPPYLVVVNDNLGMKNFLVDALVEVVGDSPDKHTLRQSRDLARRDEGVHLGVKGVADVLTAHRH